MQPNRRTLRDLLLPDLLTVEDLAFHLQRSQSAICNMLRAGVIPGRKIGKRWIVDRDALLRSLSPSQTGPALRLVGRNGDDDAVTTKPPVQQAPEVES